MPPITPWSDAASAPPIRRAPAADADDAPELEESEEATPLASRRKVSTKSRLIVTTGNEVPGRQVVKFLGVVDGLVVRATAFGDRIGGLVSGLGGGNVEQFERVCMDARREAYDRMVDRAERKGADAIIGMRYDAVEIGKFISEVLAYGTAVKLSAPELPEG